MDDAKVLELSCNILVGLMTGGIAIFSIYLTNRHNLNSAREQRAEEADRAERDRKLTYKKEVYFEAVNDMAKLIGLTQRLADNTYPESEFTAAAAQFGAGLNRVNLIAGEETMKRLSEGNIAIARAVCDIMKERLFLKILQSKIDTADKEFWSANKEIDQIDKFLGNLPETPDNHEIFRQAVDERRSHLDQQGKHMSAGSALRAEWTEHLWRLGPLCLAHMENLNKCICEITIAMRNEIDFTISEKSFKDISTGTMEKMSIIIQQMQADSKKIAEDMMTRPY